MACICQELISFYFWFWRTHISGIAYFNGKPYSQNIIFSHDEKNPFITCLQNSYTGLLFALFKEEKKISHILYNLLRMFDFDMNMTWKNWRYYLKFWEPDEFTMDQNSISGIQILLSERLFCFWLPPILEDGMNVWRKKEQDHKTELRLHLSLMQDIMYNSNLEKWMNFCW